MTFPTIRSPFAFVLSIGAIAAFATTGCAGANDDGLGTSASALVEDDDEMSSTDEANESGLEATLSGADLAGAGGVVDPSTGDVELWLRVKVNPGLFYQPAGCITSTLEGTSNERKATHVFDGCKGPFGLVSYTGTVVSTWKRDEGTLRVTHKAENFAINGAKVSFESQVTYSKAGTVWQRTRQGQSSGTTAKGKTFTHAANFTLAYDEGTKCLTRNGQAESTLGGRAWTKKVTGVEVCGWGLSLCPKKGTVELTRAKTSGEEEVKLTVDYEGGEATRVKIGTGRVVKRALVCKAD
ncbi:MAG: hypothetical protein U0169_04230 [Polyangiaceae bacterium]